MAVTIETTYPTGRGLAATVQRLDNSKYWHNDASHGAWESPAVYADNAVGLTEGESGNKALQDYAGTTLGDMGSPGKVRIRIHETAANRVVGMVDTYVLENVEVSEAVWTLAASFAAIPAAVADAVEAALAGYFADIPGAVETEMALKHGDGNYESILGSGADAVALTLSADGLGVPGFAVWITSDEAGLVVEAGSLPTDDSGLVRTMLTDGGTYYLWANAPAGYNDLVGVEFTANAAEGNEFEVTAVTAPELGASLYDLMPQVVPFVPECGDPVVKATLREVWRAFCRATGVWEDRQELLSNSALYVTGPLTPDWTGLYAREATDHNDAPAFKLAGAAQYIWKHTDGYWYISAAVGTVGTDYWKGGTSMTEDYEPAGVCAGTAAAQEAIVLASAWERVETLRVRGLYMAGSKTPMPESQYEVRDDGIILLASEREMDEAIRIEKALLPTTLCYIVPQKYLDRWGDVVAYGAKAMLRAMEGVPWTNAKQGAYWWGLFMQGVAAARGDRVDGRQSGQLLFKLPKVV